MERGIRDKREFGRDEMVKRAVVIKNENKIIIIIMTKNPERDKQ